MSSETLQTFSQGLIAFGIFLSALGGYGAYHYGKKVEKEKEAKNAPINIISNSVIQINYYLNTPENVISKNVEDVITKKGNYSSDLNWMIGKVLVPFKEQYAFH